MGCTGYEEARWTVALTCTCSTCHTAPVRVEPHTPEEWEKWARANHEYAVWAHGEIIRLTEISVPATRAQLCKDRYPRGTTCPSCDQKVQEYKRKVNSGMARALMVMLMTGGTTWQHKPTVLRGVGASARDESLLRFWGLMEEEKEKRPDGGRSGWWRVTTKGEDFVNRRITVPRYARIYNNELLFFEGEEIDIDFAIGDAFSYSELMDPLTCVS